MLGLSYFRYSAVYNSPVMLIAVNLLLVKVLLARESVAVFESILISSRSITLIYFWIINSYFGKVKVLVERKFYKSSHQMCSIKTAVLKNFSIFTGKHLCWRIFLTKSQAFSSAILWKETPTQVFSNDHCEIFKNS